MKSDDRAAKKAEDLYEKWQDRTGCDNPPRFYRDEFVAIIAAELRTAYAEIARLKTREQAYEFIQRAYDEREKALGEAYAEIHSLRADKERLKDAIRTKEKLELAACAEADELRAELQHWREAAASIGQADGHGWAEETKSLRAELAAKDKAKESDGKS